MSWYKKADQNFQDLVNSAVEEMEYMINIGEIESDDDFIDFLKTNYRANMDDKIFEAMATEVYERLKNELV